MTSKSIDTSNKQAQMLSPCKKADLRKGDKRVVM